MQTIRRSTRAVAVLGLIVGTCLMSVALPGCSGNSQVSKLTSDRFSDAIAEHDVKTILDESVSRGTYEKFTDGASANKAAPFIVRVPKDSLGKKSIGVYVAKKLPDENTPGDATMVQPSDSGSPIDTNMGRNITILYDDGLHINERLVPDAISYDARVKAFQDLGAKEFPTRVEAGGYEGIGQDAGFNSVEGNNEPRPGYVTWSEKLSDGKYITYQIYGDGLECSQLLRVAQSMY